MQLRPLLITFVSCFVLSATVVYVYIANQLREAKIGIEDNIAQLSSLKTTLKKHYSDIDEHLAPQLRALIKEKSSKENLLNQAVALHEMKSLIPIIHALPIPKLPRAVKEALSELFASLDPLLDNTLRDLKTVQRDLGEMIPMVETIIKLENEALAAIKDTSPFGALWHYIRG